MKNNTNKTRISTKVTLNEPGWNRVLLWVSNITQLTKNTVKISVHQMLHMFFFFTNVHWCNVAVYSYGS